MWGRSCFASGCDLGGRGRQKLGPVGGGGRRIVAFFGVEMKDKMATRSRHESRGDHQCRLSTVVKVFLTVATARYGQPQLCFQVALPFCLLARRR